MGEVLPQGSIKFKGTDIAGLPSYKIAHLGLGYVPEHRDIFSRPDGEAELDAWHQGYHPRSLARVAVNARYCPGMADVQAAASNRNLRWLHVPATGRGCPGCKDRKRQGLPGALMETLPPSSTPQPIWSFGWWAGHSAQLFMISRKSPAEPVYGGVCCGSPNIAANSHCICLLFELIQTSVSLRAISACDPNRT